MIIDSKKLDELSALAKVSPRLRQAMDLRNSPEDSSQRMLNALEPGTVMPIHRHHASSETVVLIRGKIEWIFYDDNGNETERVILDANGEPRSVRTVRTIHLKRTRLWRSQNDSEDNERGMGILFIPLCALAGDGTDKDIEPKKAQN